MAGSRALQQMGQRAFFPPSVKGWPGGANWLTSGTMIARQNFLSRLLNSQTAIGSRVAASTRRCIRRPPPSASQRTCYKTMLRPADACARSKRFLSGTGSAALAELSVENFQQRSSGAVYLAMATPGVPVANWMMKRRNFLLGTTAGLAIVANTDHAVRARARAERRCPVCPAPKNAVW